MWKSERILIVHLDIYKFIDDVHRQLGKMETKELKIKELESKIQKHKKVIMELLE